MKICLGPSCVFNVSVYNNFPFQIDGFCAERKISLMFSSFIHWIRPHEQQQRGA